MNRITALLIVSVCFALPAVAATDDVCWNRDLERMDFYTNPPSRGDNNFFSFTVSGTANVTMIYPNTLSMRQLPISLYELRTTQGPAVGATGTTGTIGCSNSTLNNLTYFMPDSAASPSGDATCLGKYNYQLEYPEPDTAYAGGGGVSAKFESTATSSLICASTSYSSTATDKTGGSAWLFTQWPADGTSGVQSTFSGLDKGSINATCASAVGDSTSTAYQDCQICVRTKGYWLNYNKQAYDTTPAAMVAMGNWLDFFPPKWEMLHLAYKRLVNGPLLNPLREGIGTQNGSAGWFRLQKMLPQACSGQGRPNQRIGSVDGLSYSNTANPLAEMLFNVAWTVSSQDSTPPSSWGFFSSASTHPSSEPGPNSDAGKKSGFCPGCNAGFSVLFSDGRGIDGWPNCVGALGLGIAGLTIPDYCRNAMVATAGGSSDSTTHDSYSSCNGSSSPNYPGLGTEKDGDDFLNPTLGTDVQQLTKSGGTYYGNNGSACTNDWLANVAAWMFATDLGSNSTSASADVPGTNLRLYTVGIGDNYFGELTSLQAAATAGHGLFLSASNFATLEKNITNVFLDIISNSTSFSVAAITTVQTRGTTFAFIPRFRPLGGPQWEGRLYRFRLFNEFSAGCGPAELTGGPDGGPVKDSLNPNGNASCTDVFLVDADGGFVGEDDGGGFVLLDTNQTFAADGGGWPQKTPKTAANPVWEAASLLTTRELGVISGSGGTVRNILTVNLDGGIPTPGSALITYNDLSSANVTRMTDYMKLSGQNSDFCAGMAQVTRHTYTSEQDCGKDLMKFIDGYDVQRQNTDGGTVRPDILGDIFHSSPILISPPVPPSFCDLGIINQCVPTLYKQSSATGATPNGATAYNSYLSTNANRQELLVVGANDGMLHAFQAGTETTAATFDTNNNEISAASYDDGTGAEVWAFIPADMLPKLQRYALSQSHNILVDGAPWVRDIWKDGSGASTTPDRQKQSDEFHTILVIGERTGGRHYTALDVTDTSSNPKFLWTWPPPGSLYELAEGESWNDTTPAAPPIGPVLIADPSGPITVTVNGVATNASERWVAAISGGYDPSLLRGRAIYILDAWNGQLLYKFSRYDVPSGTTCSGSSPTDVRCLMAPVAAPVGLMQSNPTRLFFDLAVVGDTDGNIWTIDMLNPGNLTGTPSMVNNWFGGLTFSQFNGGAISQKEPFFALVGSQLFAPLDPNKGGDMRVYIGSGDRDQIKVRDTDAADGGTCTLDNLRGCLRNNCTVDVSSTLYTIGASPTEALTAHVNWQASGTNYNTNTFAFDGGDNTAGACNDPVWVRTKYSAQCAGASTCSSCTSGTCACLADPNDGGTVHNDLSCDFDGGNDAGEECLDTTGKPLDNPGAYFASPTITNTRFYSVRLFDPPNYTNKPRMIDSTTQSTYNSHVFTGTDLTDVTDGGVMAADAGGWTVRHMNDQNEKAAGGAFLLGGCVAWNTEVPSVLFSGTGSDGGSVCKGGSIPSDTAFLYQGDSQTGAVQCGLSGSATQQATARFQQRSVTVTPQSLTPVVSLNTTTGQAAYSGISLEPGGKQPLTLQTGAQGVIGDVGWLDVSRNLHNCRHVPLADGGTQCQ